MTRRQTPCDKCRAVYTSNRICENCSGSGAEELPPAEDRWGHAPGPLLCKQCGGVAEEERRCYATPVCFACLPPPKPLPVAPRRQAPPPVMPAPRKLPMSSITVGDTTFSREHFGAPLVVTRKELPTLDAIPVDRHAAITKLIGFVTAEGTTDSAVAALLSEAERLKGAA